MRLFGLSILWFLGLTLVHAQPRKVANISFQRRDDQIVLTYDLIGKPKSKYRVEPYISLDGGVSRLKLTSVEGDTGKDISIGMQKQMVWDVFKDFPEGIQSDQVVFLIEAYEPRPKWMYGAGATVFVSGVGWFLWRITTALPNPPPKPTTTSH
ncbi:MAG: hypothetical protein J0L94_08215 [Rhodothermia bacterium]|nr:hypothetical protein [Rhodothermia bacterium]